jgi:flagellar assembly protein FliH
MRESSRFIAEEDIESAAPWDFVAVDTSSLLLAQKIKERDEQEEAARATIYRQQGFDDGFAQGRAQGAQEAQAKINEFIKNQGDQAARGFASLFESAQAQLDEAQQDIARGVLELACELSRQIVRQELSINPTALEPVVREALGLLIGGSKSATVRLHSDDLKALQPVLDDEFADLSLRYLADPAMNRGDCLVESAGTVVDGTVEKRWARTIANLGLELPWRESGDAQ